MSFETNPSDYQPGTLIHNHPDWKYHAAPGLSSTQVKCFVNQSPRHYQWRYILNMTEHKESDAMLLGTLTHCLVLEPNEFERRFEQELQLEDYQDVLRTVPELKAYCDKNNLQTTGVKQELIKRVMDHDNKAPVWDVMLSRQKESKKRIVSSGLWDKARMMRDGVFSNPDATVLFSQGDGEVSAWGTHEATGQLIKCRSDWLRADGVCTDLKTCGCASPDSFARDCARYGYALQEAHYTQTLNSAGIDCNLFIFVAVESEAPYLCQVYTLDDRSRSVAETRYEKAMMQLAQCQQSDKWPGYAEPISELSLPGWHLKQLENVA